MTGQNVSRRSNRLRRIRRTLIVLSALLVAGLATPASAQLYTLPATPEYGYGPSGSASGDVVNFDGRGMGMLIRGGHTAGDAIGRNESISYISAMPYATFGDTMLFGDTRLNRANSGGLAWSFGAGFRHYFSDVNAVFGLNGYLDQDQLTDHFQGYGVGFELLSHHWEWRGNMYKPYGDSSIQTNVQAADGSIGFVGDTVQFDRIRTFASALEGYDTEIGFLLPGKIATERQIRAFAGAYLYQTEADDQVGWKARLQATPLEWMELGVQVANDQIWDTTVTFNVALQFGGFKENRSSGTARYRMAEPVRRNMTIATGEVSVRENSVPVLTDAGLPLSIAHVNSVLGDLGGTGSVDNPFETIPLAQSAGADIILVHAGSTYDVPPTNSVVMRDGERILGEGLILNRLTPIPTTHRINVPEIGSIVLPPSPYFAANPGEGRPVLSGSGSAGVVLASDVEFSGFVVENSGLDAIVGTSTENAILNENLLRTSGRDGLRLIDPIGVFEVTDTVIESTNGVAFHVDGGSSSIVFSQTNDEADPGIGRIDNSSSHIVRVANTIGGGIVFDLATLDDNGGSGVLIENADGNVTIDNLSVIDSDSHGISIVGGSGTFTFRTSLRDGTVLQNTALSALNIDGLEEGGRVRFESDLQVGARQTGGFDFRNFGGTISFDDPVNIVAGAGFGFDPGINIENSLSTGSVLFRDTVSVTGGEGIGLRIAEGQFDPATGNRASVRFSELLRLTNQTGDSMLITNDQSQVLFDSVISSGRDSRGIALIGADGLIDFAGDTVIENEDGALFSGLLISDSEARIRFLNQTFVNDGLGPGAPTVNIVNNQPGDNGDAEILFENLNINSDIADSLTVLSSDNVTVETGTILTGNATSVDLQDSGIRMTFASIDNDGGGNAIRIIDTYAPGDPEGLSFFQVLGNAANPGVGSGGIIEDTTGPAVFLQNSGIVRLNQMLFDDNQQGFEIAFTDLEDPPRGEFALFDSEVQDSDFIGLRGLNIPNLIMEDVIWDNNGDNLPAAAGIDGAETILLNYDEAPNDPDLNNPADYDSPFLVFMRNVSVLDNSDDAVIIRALAGAENAHLNLDIEDSDFTATDADPDIVGGITRDLSVFDQFNDSAFIVSWNGPMRINSVDNEFSILSGNNDPQVGLDIRNDHSFDFSEIVIRRNDFTIIGDGQIGTSERHNGLRIDLEGESFAEIELNNIQGSGGDITGIEIDMDGSAELFVLNNVVTANTFRDEGIIFGRLTEPTELTFEGNAVNVAGIGDIRELGVSIRGVGILDLFSTADNAVFTIGNGRDFVFRGPTPRGQILINGQQLP